MKPILILCPTPRDYRELPCIPHYQNQSFIFHDYETETLEKLIYEDGHEQGRVHDLEAFIDRIVHEYRGRIAGVMSSDDYPGINIASGVARELHLSCAQPDKVLLCQHKYYSRLLQRQYVPEAVPCFALVAMDNPGLHSIGLPFPFFIKPVKSVFSCFAQTVSNQQELQDVFANKLPARGFLQPFNQLLKRYTFAEHDSFHMIAEGLLSGHQGTVEGYLYEGRAELLGITDSIMYPGTICFERFEYPSKLSASVQERVHDIARRCMEGIGLGNGMFNMEFFYHEPTDSISIIEINPRMASQFADLYEKVDGTNSYEVLVALALGKKPVVKHRQGMFKTAVSAVLRSFENKMVCAVPDPETLEQAYNMFPELRVEIFARAGKKLSHDLQDGKSYRYGLIHVGAQDQQELDEKVARCKAMLPFKFQPLAD